MDTIKLEHSQWARINEIVTDIYSGHDIYDLRINFLNKINELIPYEKGFIDLGHQKDTHVVFFDPVSTTMDKDYLVSYYKDYESLDTMFWFFARHENSIYRETDYVSKAMMEASVFAREWLGPQDIFYSMGSKIGRGRNLYGSVNLWRSLNHGDFSDEELYILEVLNIHLCIYFSEKFPNGIRRNEKNDYSDTLMHLYHLTARESDVVRMIYQGCSIRETAKKLFISENTVKKHTFNIFQKMNIHTRAQLVRIVHGYMTAAAGELSEISHPAFAENRNGQE